MITEPTFDAVLCAIADARHACADRQSDLTAAVYADVLSLGRRAVPASRKGQALLRKLVSLVAGIADFEAQISARHGKDAAPHYAVRDACRAALEA
jgi:hypothetical protein